MGERIKFFETNTKESIKRGNGDIEQAKKIKSKVINGSPNISIIPVNRPKALITDQKNDKTGQKDKPHYILFTRDEEHLQRKEAERLKEGGTPCWAHSGQRKLVGGALKAKEGA